MLAAAAWLCSILAVPYGDRACWMVMFLVFVAVAAWIYVGVEARRMASESADMGASRWPR